MVMKRSWINEYIVERLPACAHIEKDESLNFVALIFLMVTGYVGWTDVI